MAYPDSTKLLLSIIIGLGAGFLISNFRVDLAIIVGLVDLLVLIELMKCLATKKSGESNAKMPQQSHQ